MKALSSGCNDIIIEKNRTPRLINNLVEITRNCSQFSDDLSAASKATSYHAIIIINKLISDDRRCSCDFL